MSAPVLVNRYAHAFIDAARAKGYDDQSIRHCAGLTALGSLNEPVYGPPALSNLSRGVKLLMRDEFFGALKSPCKPGAFQMMCELAVDSTTLEQALRKSFRLYALLSDEVRFELHRESAGRAGVSIGLQEMKSDENRFFVEWFMTFWRGIASWLIGEKIPMLSARFIQAPQAPPSEYRVVYSDHCQFASEIAGFTFDAKYLARPVIRDQDDVEKLMATARIDLVTVTGVGGMLNSRLYHLLVTQLRESRRLLSMEEVAGQYHMSTQTLRRRLDQENSSFRAVKEEARRNYVMQLLGNVDIPLGHVSELSGYAESTELTRAVKGWTGLSPRAYRNKILGGRVR